MLTSLVEQTEFMSEGLKDVANNVLVDDKGTKVKFNDREFWANNADSLWLFHIKEQLYRREFLYFSK